MSNNPLREVKGAPTTQPPVAEADVLAALQARIDAAQARIDGVNARLTVSEREALKATEVAYNATDRVAAVEAEQRTMRSDIDAILASMDKEQEAKKQTKKPNRVLGATWYSENRYVRYGTRTVVISAAGAAVYFGARAGVRKYKAFRAGKAPAALDMTSDFAQ